MFEHINKFLEVVGPIKINGVSHDQFRLRIFNISLTDAAEIEEDDDPDDITDIFNDFNYLLKIDKDLFTFDIQGIGSYEEYELNNPMTRDLEEWLLDNEVPYQLYDHICEPYRFKNGVTKWPTCSSNIDGFCNGGEYLGCFGNFHELDYNVLVKLQECWWKINAHEVAPFTRLESYGQKSYANIKTEKAHDPYLKINNIFDRNYDTSNTSTQDDQGHEERKDDRTLEP
ncbi:hypothetical protein Tco_0786128 [Tanacetum coccineum]